MYYLQVQNQRMILKLGKIFEDDWYIVNRNKIQYKLIKIAETKQKIMVRFYIYREDLGHNNLFLVKSSIRFTKIILTIFYMFYLQINTILQYYFYHFMGFGSSKIVYSVQVENQQQPSNSTKARRSPQFIQGLYAYPDEKLRTMKDILLNTFQKYSDNNGLGTLYDQKGVDEQGKQKIIKRIKHKTYKQIKASVDAIGNGILELKLAPQITEYEGMKMKFVGVFSKNRAQWLLVDYAAILFGFILVPIYDTLGPQNIPYVLNHTKVQNCFCTKQSIDILLKTKDLGNLKHIISFDPLPQETVAKLKARGIINVLELNQLIEKGKKGKNLYHDVSPNDCLTFSYTSGTTGPPKGAMLSHKNFASFCAVLKTNKDIKIAPDGRYLSYLPLPHVLQRVCVYGFLYSGAEITCYSGDVQKIKDDLEVVKPTFFCSVPRLYNRFYDLINDKFEKTTGFPKKILDRALAVKLKNVKTNGSFVHRLYDRLVFKKTKAIFGGQLGIMISGSAPILPHVHSFMKIIACAPLIQGYGQTESTGASFVTSAYDPTTDHVGGPTANVEYKLEDIPEMNYTHLDKDEQGRLAPRGQICMRGPGVFLGYYKDAQKTKETIDADGWLHTGDIGIILPETQALKIIDRKKNIFKLQQGEYVASQKVEATYLKKGDLAEMFLYGDSKESFAVGILVPHKHYIEQIASKKGITGTFKELCLNKEIRIQVITQLNDFTKKNGLVGFEQAKNIYLQSQPFATKGIITNTMKLQRHEAKKVYKQIIEDLYKEGFLGGGKA